MAPLAEAFVRVRADPKGFKREVEDEFARTGTSAGAKFDEAFKRDLTGKMRETSNKVAKGLGGKEFDGAGQQSGKGFGEGFSRDLNGRLRDARGRFAAGLGSGPEFRDSGTKAKEEFTKPFVSEGGGFARKFTANLESAFKALPKVEITADSTGADRKVADLRARLRELSSKTIGVDLDAAKALVEVKAIKKELDGIGRSATIDVRADIAEALAKLQEVKREADSAGDTKKVKVEADTGAALSGIRQVGIALLALSAVPIATTLGVGILSLAPAFAAAGLGAAGLAAVAIPSITRITAALAAQKAQQQGAIQAGIQAQAQALAMAGAQQQLTQAIRQQGYAHVQALDAVRSAVQQLAQQEISAAEAERSLTLARIAARQHIEDLRNSLIDSGLAIQQDRLNIDQARLALVQYTAAKEAAYQAQVQQAQVSLAAGLAAQKALLADPNATADQKAAAQLQIQYAQQQLKYAQQQKEAYDLQKAQAKLAYQQALQQLKEQELAYKRLREEERLATKQGVEGSDQVRLAREALARANQQVIDSERALAQARQNVARTDKASSDAIAAARRGVTSASLQGAAANAQLTTSMNALSPSAKTLMGHWQGLTGAFGKWQRSLEPTVLPLFGRGIDLLKGSLPALTPIVHNAAGAFGGLITDLGSAAKSPWWTEFRKQMTGLVGPSITGLGKIIGNVVTAFAGIFKAFLPQAPTVLNWLQRITGEFANWGKNLGNSNGFKALIDYVKSAGPQLGKTLADIGKAFGHLVTSLAPLAGSGGLGALSTFRLLATAIQGLSPGEIQAIATAILAIRGGMVAVKTAGSVVSTLKDVRDGFGKVGEKLKAVRDGFGKVADKASGAASATAAAGKKIGSALADAGRGAGSLAVTAWSKISSAAKAAVGVATSSGQKIGSALASAGKGAASVASTGWSKIGSAAKAAADVTASASGKIAGAAKAAGSGALDLAKLGLSYTKAGLLAAASAVKFIAVQVAQLAVKAATAAWAAVQWLLDAALNANPIGLVVIAIAALVAGIIYAYTHFETFRKIVNTVFEFVKKHWQLVVIAILGPLGLIVVLIVKYWKQIWAGIKIAIDAINVIVQWMWNKVLKPVFDIIKWYVMNIMIPYFKLLWAGAKLVFAGISAAVSFMWDKIIKPIWDLIKWYVQKILIPELQYLWKVAQQVFKDLGNIISWVWQNIIKPAFDLLKSAIGGVGDAFNAGANAIKSAWQKVQQFTKDPINFVIGTVYNKGIVGMWNTVMGWLHLPNSLKLGTIPLLASGGTLDNPAAAHPMVTNRPTAIVGEGNSAWPEYVIPTDPRYRGRAQGLWSQAGGHLQMLAGGGILGGILGTVKHIAGSVLNLGKDALSLITNPKAIWDKLTGVILHKADSIATGPFGKAAAAVPNKLLGEAWTVAKQIISTFSGAFGGSGNGAKALAFAVAQLGKPYQWGATGPNTFDCSGLTMRAWESAGQSIGRTTYDQVKAGRPGSRSTALPGDLWFPEPGHVEMFAHPRSGGTDEMIEAPHTGDVVKFAPFGSGGVVRLIASAGGGGAGGSGQSAAAAQAFAQAQFNQFGWGAGQMSPLVSLWNQESNWRWNARNPSSGAYGIPQSLPPGKMASAGADYLTNAFTQVRWGLGYIHDTYGSPAGAWAHEISHNWYDKGGWLAPGASMAINGTGRPEAVLTGFQWDSLNTALGRLSGGGLLPAKGSARTDTTPPAPHVGRSGPAVQFGDVHLHDGVDIDTLSSRMSFSARAGSLG